ncbi:hypothetical protein AB0N09_42030 [Streptomyces erythrochromogenes]|uniref:hypothetical protein n=1 Tax=Streptomyces erythrochromogenes TaxID=285574 RepID=UPI003429C2FB
MHTASGPFPIHDEVTNTTSNLFYKTTELERGQIMLAHFVYFTGDDMFDDANGWQRFNTNGAIPAAAALIRDVLTYIHQHAGRADAVRRTMGALIELADTDHDEDADQDGGVIGGLTGSLSEKRLTQIAHGQTELGDLLKLLAAHLGVQPRP